MGAHLGGLYGSRSIILVLPLIVRVVLLYSWGLELIADGLFCSASETFFVTFQYKLARCPRAEMHRGVADLVYNIRIPRIAWVLRGTLRHQIRQKLVSTEAGLAKGCICCSTGASAVAHESFTGMTFFKKHFCNEINLFDWWFSLFNSTSAFLALLTRLLSLTD